MTDWRTLCEELLDELLARPLIPDRALIDRARAALAAEADGPAVPEGREPAAVVGEPSDEELLELMPETMRDEFSYAAKVCADATGNQVKPGIFRVCLNTAALDYARAVLARWGHQPTPPAEGEVAEFITQLKSYAEYGTPIRLIPFVITRAADLLQQLHPTPVQAADRLPELRGMFERILCVARSSGGRHVGNIELADRLIKAVVSWGALPLPAVEVEQ